MGKKKTPAEECTRCELLDTAWHTLAFHPAIVPPDWEPGNGQSYVEAVLDHLNSQDREEERRTARDDTCPGCDERQARASQLIDYFSGLTAPLAPGEAADAAAHYLEDR